MALVQVIPAASTGGMVNSLSPANDPVTVTTGNTLVMVGATQSSSVPPASFTDHYGNTWKAFSVNPFDAGALGANNALLYGYIADNIVGGTAETFTLTTTGIEWTAYFVLEFSGRNPSGALDQLVTFLDSGYHEAHGGGSITINTNGEDIVGFGVSVGANAADTFTANTAGGFAIPANGQQGGNGASYQPCFVQVKQNVSASSTPYVASYTSGNYVQSAGFVLSLLPAPSGGGGGGGASQGRRGMMMGVG